jgi:hypothetical protein
MGEGRKPDKRGTIWDWPVAVIVGGLALLVVVSKNGQPTILVWLIIGFGALAQMIRAGAFTPRGRDRD